MDKKQKRQELAHDDAILDIIGNDVDSDRAQELTRSVDNIYELWALAKMAEHARRDVILDYLSAAGCMPVRVAPAVYRFKYEGLDAEYSRLRGTLQSICLSVPELIEADVADDATVSKYIDYVAPLAGVEIGIRDGFVEAKCRLAPVTSHDAERAVKDAMRRLRGAAGLLRRLLSDDINN